MRIRGEAASAGGAAFSEAEMQSTLQDVGFSQHGDNTVYVPVLARARMPGLTSPLACRV